MPLIAFGLIVINIGLGVVISSAVIMLLTSFLHTSWWEAIPALDFSQGILIGLLFSCFQMATTLSTSKADIGGAIFQAIFAIAIVPFLLPWVVDALNNNLITSMPDISYATSILFTIIGLGLAIPPFLLMKFTEFVSENQ